MDEALLFRGFAFMEELEPRLLLSGSDDISQVRLWDGELHDSTADASHMLNTMGGNPVQGIHATISYTTDTVHTGLGAYEIKTNGAIPVGGFDFIGTALTGFGPNTQYVDTRDLTPYSQIEFWVNNQTGSTFDLNFEIKDYSNSDDQKASYDLVVGTSPAWTKLVVPLDLGAGWKTEGTPDLSRAKLLSLVFNADRGQPVQGSIFVDDMDLVERGGPVDPATAPAGQLVEQIAARQFDALWGSRDRTTGFEPAISSFADVTALNVTAGLVQMLPAAADRGWIARGDADACVNNIVVALGTMMNNTPHHLPPRYADRVTLQPDYVLEESPADAAMMFLSLYQYQSLPTTSSTLRDTIQTVLNRFDFGPFVTPGGWCLSFHIDTGHFDASAYDSYSGEPWLISLAASLSSTHPVPITDLWNSATNRVKDHLTDPSLAQVVSTSTDSRAPFVQWIFPLFVDVAGRGVDSYTDHSLATNPYDNAVLYQRDVDAKMAQIGRGLLLEPDAADDGTGGSQTYHAFSAYDDFGQSNLFMPWSVADAFLADPTVATASLRTLLENGLDGPFGLLDSAQWSTGASEPTAATSRCDLWNTTLSTMAFIQYLYGGNGTLATLPDVDAALKKVFPSSPAIAAKPTISISDVQVPSRGGTATFQVTLSSASAGPVDVHYFTADSTAISASYSSVTYTNGGVPIIGPLEPLDYTPTSGTLSLAAGQTTATISVPVSVNSLPEPANTFFVNLTAPDGATIADSQGVGTILNDTTPTEGGFALNAWQGVGGKPMSRSMGQTRLLKQGQSLTLSWNSTGANDYQVGPIFSNDGGPASVGVQIDEQSIGQFIAVGTRQDGAAPGSGWNQFDEARQMPAQISRGKHQMTITVLQSDPTGVELDAILFTAVLVGGGKSSIPAYWITPVNVTMTGPGSAQWIDSAAPSNLPQILLAGTTAASLLTITPRAALDMGDIYSAGTIKGISAGRCTLKGDVTIVGSVGSLAFAGATGGHSITIGAPDPVNSAAVLTLGRVTDLSVDSGTPIRSLTATQWVDTSGQDSSITAPWIGSMSIGGSFQPALNLDGRFNPRQTLGSASIAGDLLSHTWNIAGNVGPITVKGNTADWTLGNQGAPVGAVTSITLGTVGTANLYVNNKITTLKAIAWGSGTVNAGSIGTLGVTGKAAVPARVGIAAVPAISGDFSANVNLTQNGLIRGMTLGSATIAGNLMSQSWNVVGDMGVLTVNRTAGGTAAAPLMVHVTHSISGLVLGAVSHTDFWAGMTGVPSQTRHAAVGTTFDDPQAAIKSISVRGWTVPTGTTPPAFFEDTNFSAAKLPSASLLNVQTDNGQTPFGFWATSITSVKGTDNRLKPTTTWTWPKQNPVPDLTIQIV
jgi:hypothetical protein